jgi:hypothetical protein
MYSEAREAVEAAYLWIGEKRAPAARTIPRASGNLNVDLDAEGNFIGLEMLRMVSDREAKRFYAWAHRRWTKPRGKPHWPCSALMTLMDFWEYAETLVCPGCRAKREERERDMERARSRSAPPRRQWNPEPVPR